MGAKGFARCAALFVLSLAGCGSIAWGPTSVIAVHFIDVGQGDATLVISPSGEVALIDGGHDRTALEYLETLHIDHLDLLIATSLDPDHLGGLVPVLETLPVDRVATNPGFWASDAFRAFDAAVSASGARRVDASRGRQLALGGLIFEVLNPPPRTTGPETGNGSVVLRLACPGSAALSLGEAGTSFLFASDMDATTESDLLSAGLELRADVLKVAAHGACYSTSPAFLQAVAPHIAVVSVGLNDRGDPCPEVLARLAAAGTTVWQTDRDGTVAMESSCLPPAGEVNNARPTASFTFTPISPTVGESITADATDSSDPDGAIASYAWTFSDGAFATGAVVTHRYASPGSYWMCLTVADNLGATSTQCQNITVPALPDVRIECVLYYGLLALVESDEHVQIRNFGGGPQDLTGWTLRNLSRASPAFTFPSYVLEPGAAVRVYTNMVRDEWGRFTFGSDRAIWSNTTSDIAALFDASGQEISRCAYPLRGRGFCSSCSQP